MAAARATVHQLKITIFEIEPPIWRRVLVPSNTTLAQLHRVIQAVLGWGDHYEHLFDIGGEVFSDDGRITMDEARTRLDSVVGKGQWFSYTYDVGDDWEHRIDVEDVLPAEPGASYPRCIAGARACPPTDVGGTGGYEDFLDAIGDPDHPEHDYFAERFPKDFDPERFDLLEINAALTPIRH